MGESGSACGRGVSEGMSDSFSSGHAGDPRWSLASRKGRAFVTSVSRIDVISVASELLVRNEGRRQPCASFVESSELPSPALNAIVRVLRVLGVALSSS